MAASSLADALTVSSPDVSMLGSLAPDDLPDKLQLSTPDELEEQYALRSPAAALRSVPVSCSNAEITGFCTVPEAMVRLDIDSADAPHLWRRQYPIAQTLRDAASVIIDRWFQEGKIVLAHLRGVPTTTRSLSLLRRTTKGDSLEPAPVSILEHSIEC